MQIKVDIREHTLIKLLKALNNDYKFNFDISVERMDLGDIAIWNGKKSCCYWRERN